jgi:hypothetical protein
LIFVARNTNKWLERWLYCCGLFNMIGIIMRGMKPKLAKTSEIASGKYMEGMSSMT